MPNFDAPGWFALARPAGLPPSVIATLRKALAEVLVTPTLATRLEALGQTLAPVQMDVRAALGTELATWKKLFSERKIVVES